MLVEVVTGLSAIKSAFDIAKGLKDIDDATRRNAAVIELQEKLLTAQSTQSNLAERIRELEEKVVSLETWNTEKQRYQLNTLPTGSFAYALKPEAQGSEPPHYICAACYQRGKVSILQKKPGNISASYLSKPPMYVCPECKAEILQ